MLAPSASVCRSSSSASPTTPNASSPNRRAPKRRIVRQGPSIARGGMTACRREPSGRRASTMGADRSSRSASGARMRCASRMIAASSSARGTASMAPKRSTKHRPAPLTMISSTVGSSSSGSSAPSPTTSSNTAATMRSRRSIPSSGSSRTTSAAMRARSSNGVASTNASAPSDASSLRCTDARSVASTSVPARVEVMPRPDRAPDRANAGSARPTAPAARAAAPGGLRRRRLGRSRRGIATRVVTGRPRTWATSAGLSERPGSCRTTSPKARLVSGELAARRSAR